MCPVLHIPIVLGAECNNFGGPSVDRKRPAEGYVPGNVRVISYRANLLKSNASCEELRLVYEDSVSISAERQ